MLINLSNHPLNSWSRKQKNVAKQQFGPIIDLPFPPVPTDAGIDDIINLTYKYVDECLRLVHENRLENSMGTKIQNAIHVMGEMTFVYQFVQKMSELGVLCVASTSKRIAQVNDDGSKTAVFEFVRFRPFTIELY